MNTPLIEFKNITKRFGAQTVLENVNLQIYEGAGYHYYRSLRFGQKRAA